MSSNHDSIKSPLARVRGLGAAHSGTHHFIHQRLTAIANIPLVIWALWNALAVLPGADYTIFTYWLSMPVNAFLTIMLVISLFYHAALGLQIIIEDYVTCECSKIGMLIAVKLGAVLGAAVSIFSICSIAFGV